MNRNIPLPTQADPVTLSVVDEGSGPPLVFVHGFPLDHTMWRGQVEGLADRFRVIAPDLRGFGASTVTPGGVPLGQFADDLVALLDALGVTAPVALCGLSMGGYIAFEFWHRHRTRLRALILCDTRSAADAPDVAQNRLKTAERAETEGVGFLPDAMLARLFAPVTFQRQPLVIEATRQKIESAPPLGVAAASRGMAQRPDWTARLPEIDVPTLVLCGTHDGISPVAEMRALAARIPAARFVEVPDAGHMSPLENPAAVNGAIREFLR